MKAESTSQNQDLLFYYQIILLILIGLSLQQLANALFVTSCIMSTKDDPAVKEQAFKLMEEAIQNGDLVCVFPEGTLTRDGRLVKFRSGYERVLKNIDTPVIPIAMTGLWGSYFSRKGGKAFIKLPKPSRRKMFVKILKPIHKDIATADYVQDLIHTEIDKINKTF